MKERTLVAGSGFPLDGASFAQHAVACADRGRFDAAKPATLALLCLDGAVLWKKDNAQPVKRETKEHSSYHTSASAARKLMQYKWLLSL